MNELSTLNTILIIGMLLKPVLYVVSGWLVIFNEPKPHRNTETTAKETNGGWFEIIVFVGFVICFFAVLTR